MFKNPLYQKSFKKLNYYFEENKILKRLFDHQYENEDYIKDIAHTKRLLERYTTDPDFKKELDNGNYDIIKKYNIDINPEDVRFHWDNSYHLECIKNKTEFTPQVKKYLGWIMEKLAHRDRIREIDAVPENEKFRIWRERQNNRMIHVFGIAKSIGIVHPPFSMELSKGCSGNCWFCGFGAEEKEGDYLYTDKNKKEYREVLHVLKDVMGNAAATGFLYSATDPLDNPDYEQFLIDYAVILGYAPQITTSLATRDIERTRRLIWLNHKLGSDVDRFSMLSVGVLNKLHENFTAEELLYVELIPQNIESNSMIANAGRAADNKKQMEKKATSAGVTNYIHDNNDGDSISCMSGFDINMFDKSVRLVTPAKSNKKWPYGFWIYESAKFKDAQELKNIMNSMINKYMLEALEEDSIIAFLKGFELEIDKDCISLSTNNSKIEVDYGEVLPGLKEIAGIISKDNHTAKQIVDIMKEKHNQKESDTWDTLNLLFQDGLLDEEPGFFF